MSATTEWRLARTGEGPPRIKLSRQRWGYPEKLFNEWLESRFEWPLKPAARSVTTTVAQKQSPPGATRSGLLFVDHAGETNAGQQQE